MTSQDRSHTPPSLQVPTVVLPLPPLFYLSCLLPFHLLCVVASTSASVMLFFAPCGKYRLGMDGSNMAHTRWQAHSQYLLDNLALRFDSAPSLLLPSPLLRTSTNLESSCQTELESTHLLVRKSDFLLDKGFDLLQQNHFGLPLRNAHPYLTHLRTATAGIRGLSRDSSAVLIGMCDLTWRMQTTGTCKQTPRYRGLQQKPCYLGKEPEPRRRERMGPCTDAFVSSIGGSGK